MTSCYRLDHRNGYKDLYYMHRITLQEAIQCKPVKVPLMSGKSIMLPMDQIITPKTVKCIKGEGMPIFKKEDYMDESMENGDLYVLFDIVFPAKISAQHKAKITQILYGL